MKEVLKTENLQQQLYNQLAGMILRRELPPGKPLPSFRELEKLYQVSSTTVRRVMERLQREKLIHTRRNRPALVTLPEPSSKHLRIGVVMYQAPNVQSVDKFAYETGPFGWLLYRSIFLYAKHCNISCMLIERTDSEKIAAMDGVIGIAGDEDFYNDLAAGSRMFVNLMAGDNAGKPGVICLDRQDAMVKSALYLLSGGVKSFFVVGYRCKNLINQHRKQGFDAALLERNIAPEQIVELDGFGIDKTAGREVAGEIMRRDPVRPVGILMRGDYVACGVVNELMQHNWVPKKDFFVIGMTDLEEAARWEVPLTVQSCPYESLGAAAVDMLKKSIASGSMAEPLMIKNRLIIRKT